MKDMKRALRRHHAARLKHARGHHWGRDIRHEPKLLGKVIDTPTPCSCWMCGNPRRYLKELTRQERRAIDREKSSTMTSICLTNSGCRCSLIRSRH